MQLAKRFRLVDGDFRRELATAFGCADTLVAGTAINVAAALEFNQVTPVAEDYPLFEQFNDSAQGLSVAEGGEDREGGAGVSHESAIAAPRARAIASPSRPLTFSPSIRTASGIVTRE